MLKTNYRRKNCRDVFNAFLVTLSQYSGFYEFPNIYPTYWIPNKLIPFSKAISCTNKNQWVHFYEDDYLFERIWRNPKRYLEILREYNGVILPDFSVYRDMPYVMQLWNIYRSRAIGSWLQMQGIKVIVNIRYANQRTYKRCCDGISQHCVIAVGTHGTIKNKVDRQFFSEGLDVIVKTLKPIRIVVYGAAPDSIFAKYKQQGIEILQFDSDYSISHREVK